MASGKAIGATLILGGGGATAGAAMGGAFSSSQVRDSDNHIPQGSEDVKTSGSAIASPDNTRTVLPSESESGNEASAASGPADPETKVNEGGQSEVVSPNTGEKTSEGKVEGSSPAEKTPEGPTEASGVPESGDAVKGHKLAAEGGEGPSATPTTTPTTLEKENDFGTTYKTEGLIGKKYSKYLLGTYKNETEWNNRFKEISQATSDDFKNTAVKSGFSTKEDSKAEADKALNKICEGYYKKTVSDIQWTTSLDDTKSKKRNDFWKFCSIFKETPQTLEEAKDTELESSYKSKIGETNKEKLLSVKEEVNNEIWKIKEQELKAEDSPSEYFKSVKDNSETNKLRDKCKAAYQLTSTDPETATAPKTENVLKYCSL